jgi:putative DNA primase/helicase
MTLDDLLSRLKGVRGSGAQRTALCPAHRDSSNSLSVGIGRDGRLLLNCFASCTVDAICGALGIDVKELFPARPVPKVRAPKVEPKRAITTADLAEAKKLPVEWLHEQGVEDFPDGGGVAIGYFLEDGSQAPRVRRRTALRAKDGSSWIGSGEIIPYGLWKLDEWRSD